MVPGVRQHAGRADGSAAHVLLVLVS